MDGLDQIGLERPGQPFLYGRFQRLEMRHSGGTIQRVFALSHFRIIRCAGHGALEEFAVLVVLVAYATAGGNRR
jgi:hypothetical protein